MGTEKRFYSARAVRIGAFLGGPLAATYLLAENYKAMGHPEKVTKTWLIGGFIALVVFGALILLPEPATERVPRFLIPLLTMLAAHLLVKYKQEDELHHLLQNGGEHYSAWRAAGISLLLALITLAVVVGVAVGIDFFLGSDV